MSVFKSKEFPEPKQLGTLYDLAYKSYKNGETIFEALGFPCRVCQGTWRYAMKNCKCVKCYRKNKTMDRTLNAYEARQLGMKIYVGATCGKCKSNNRYAANGNCIACQKIRVKNEQSICPNIEKRKYQMFSRLKYRATKEGIKFNLKIEDVEWNTICPVFGFQLDYFNRIKRKTATFDRLIPEKGYTKGNVFIISHSANRKKVDSSLEDLQKICQYIVKNT